MALGNIHHIRWRWKQSATKWLRYCTRSTFRMTQIRRLKLHQAQELKTSVRILLTVWSWSLLRDLVSSSKLPIKVFQTVYEFYLPHLTPHLTEYLCFFTFFTGHPPIGGWKLVYSYNAVKYKILVRNLRHTILGALTPTYIMIYGGLVIMIGIIISKHLKRCSKLGSKDLTY